MSKLCYVTSFFDIGRENWVHYRRNFENYFKAFCNMVKMFNSFGDDFKDYCELIVFIDEKYYNRVLNNSRNITLISINERFMKNNIQAWSRLEKEREIMSSESYKNLVRHRYMCPETYEAKYTLINHAKVDFVNFATIISGAEYFCWVDFGYCGDEDSIARYPLDINKLDKNKINYVLLNPLTESDSDVINTIVNAPERVGGGFFFGSREKIKEYQKLYNEVHGWFQDNNLADDDQNFVIQCSLRKPELFRFECLGGWFKGLTNYQITM